MWPHDGLTPTLRNMVFLLTTTAIFGCLIYAWGNLEQKEESLYLSLFSVSCVFFAILFGLVSYDSITNRDLKRENNLDSERKTEYDSVEDNIPNTLREDPRAAKENFYNGNRYYGNSFDNMSDLWRTILIAVIASTIYFSFIVVYSKHPDSTKDDAGYIILISVATVAMLVHVLMLIFQLVHYFKKIRNKKDDDFVTTDNLNNNLKKETLNDKKYIK